MEYGLDQESADEAAKHHASKTKVMSALIPGEQRDVINFIGDADAGYMDFGLGQEWITR